MAWNVAGGALPAPCLVFPAVRPCTNKIRSRLRRTLLIFAVSPPPPHSPDYHPHPSPAASQTPAKCIESEEMAYEEAHLPGPPTAGAEDDAAVAAQKLSRRACDCCRKRKVKCDGGNPCTPCQKAMLPCAYLQPPKKKGPKGLRSQRVLHMLRRIDDHMAAGLLSPPTPQQTSAFGNWGWHTQSSGSNGGAMPPPNAHAHSDDSYGPHTSVAPDQPYYPPSQSSMPPPPQQSPFPPHSMRFSPEAQFASWTNKSPSVPPPTSDPSSTMSPSTSSSLHLRLPAECFLPYIKLFFDHMFPIMPVIDRNIYVNPNLYTDSSLLTPDEYCFLCSICAATMVQLDDSISQPPAIHPPKRNDDLFAEECLRERKVYDFIESPSRLSVMTSFFLFAYYGNNEKHDKAWHYLQESITFAQTLNMDDENAYRDLDPTEAQWRRRLYWLLFITERAYAVQRRKHTRLYANVKQPSIFDNEEAQLLNGFVNLANLFAAVDDDFVKAWRGSRKQSLCDEQWLAKTQSQLDNAVLALGSVSETQQMDIRVTREWLHMLAWQMGVSNGLMWGEGESDGTRLYYPVEIAKRVVEITSGANALALDSHGIGMVSHVSPERVFRRLTCRLAGTKTLRHRRLPRRRPPLHRRRPLRHLRRRQRIPAHPLAKTLQHPRQGKPLPQAPASTHGGANGLRAQRPTPASARLRGLRPQIPPGQRLLQYPAHVRRRVDEYAALAVHDGRREFFSPV